MASESTKSTSRAAGRARCPICGAPSETAFRPFCSSRCADVDLSRWLRGAYAIPCADADGDEDGEGAPSPGSDQDGPVAGRGGRAGSM